MKRPGLTEAQERELRDILDGKGASSARWLDWAIERGFIEPRNGRCKPRGQAALAAPRVTAAELEMLERLESWEGTIHGRDVTVAKSLRKKGLALCGFGSSGYRRAKITPAGTTALNNIRAASGSPEWKEVL